MAKMSPARRGLLWWFAPPANPYISANIAVDFSAARRYLAELPAAAPAGKPSPRVTVQHLVMAAIGRVLRDYPAANARVLNGRIVPERAVGIAMPVNLVGHEGGKRSELSMAILKEVDRKTLVDVAGETRELIEQERKGKQANPLVRLLFGFAELAPTPAFNAVMDRMDGWLQNPAISAQFYASVPATTALSNPGAAFGAGLDGTAGFQGAAVFRGASVNLPTRFVSIGTLWGISVVQDEVVAVDGKPAVRPMLPVLLVFDHRIIDGVLAGKLLARLVEILQDPAKYFGATGHLPVR